jgi:outer membrane protein TolC
MLNGKITVLFLLMSILAFSKPKEDRVLTLSKAIKLASDSSLAAFKAQNLYLSGYWEYRLYKAQRLPFVSMNIIPISYNNNIVRRYDSESNMDIYKSQRSFSSESRLSIDQNVDWTGGSFYLDSELGYFKNFGSTSREQYTAIPFRVGYSQNLFGYNAFKWDKKIEPLKFEKAQKELAYNLEEISENVVDAYFGVILAETNYKLARQNISNSDTLFHIGEERYRIGSLSLPDLLNLELSVVNARASIGEAQLELQKSRFKLAVLLDCDPENLGSLVIPDKIVSFVVNKDVAVQYAFQNNPVFLAQKELLLKNERQLDQAIKNGRFSAKFSASLGFNQIAGNLSDVYRDPLRQDVVSVGLSVPILDWGVRKGRVNMAKRNMDAATITANQAEQSFVQNVVVTIDELNLRESKLKYVILAKEIANQAFDRSKKMFQIGKIDVNTLNSAISKQIEAECNYISTLQSYWTTYFKLRKLTLFDFETNNPIRTEFEDMMFVD